MIHGERKRCRHRSLPKRRLRGRRVNEAVRGRARKLPEPAGGNRLSRRRRSRQAVHGTRHVADYLNPIDSSYTGEPRSSGAR